MSTDKSEIKMLVAEELGSRFDDALESIQREVSRAEGAMSYLARVAALLAQGGPWIDAEVAGERASAESAKFASELLGRVQVEVQKLAAAAVSERDNGSGKVQGLQFAVACVKKLHDDAAAKRQAMLNAVQEQAKEAVAKATRDVADMAQGAKDAAPPAERAPSTRKHPGKGMKTQRTLPRKGPSA